MFRIQLIGDIRTIGRRQVAAAAAASQELVTEHVNMVLGNARGQWPVVTGRSRSGLDARFQDHPHGYSGEVVNHVEYALDVRPTRLGGVISAWERYVHEPMAAAAALLPAELVTETLRRTSRARVT